MPLKVVPRKSSSPEPLLDCQSIAFVEGLWRDSDQNGKGLSPEWRRLFRELQDGNGFHEPSTRQAVARETPPPAAAGRQPTQTRPAINAERILATFRDFGHRAAQIDPLGLPGATNNTAPWDLLEISDDEVESAAGQMSSVRELITQMTGIYCGSIGYEFQHIDEPKLRKWLIDHIEGPRQPVSSRTRRRWLRQLVAAAEFERLIRKKFPGAKTFSLAPKA